jgi:hypothetical protein
LATQNLPRLAKLRTAQPRVRGLYVAVLALILVGNLARITFSWAPQSGTRIYVVLAFLWILALVALLLTFRIWKATVWPSFACWRRGLFGSSAHAWASRAWPNNRFERSREVAFVDRRRDG